MHGTYVLYACGCMSVFVHIRSVYTGGCMFVYACMCTDRCTHMHAPICMHMYMQIDVPICMHVYRLTYVPPYAQHVYSLVYVPLCDVHTCVRTHVFQCAQGWRWLMYTNHHQTGV